MTKKNNTDEMVICPSCGKSLKIRGLLRHLAVSHNDLYNKVKYKLKVNSDSIVIDKGEITIGGPYEVKGKNGRVIKKDTCEGKVSDSANNELKNSPKPKPKKSKKIRKRKLNSIHENTEKRSNDRKPKVEISPRAKKRVEGDRYCYRCKKRFSVTWLYSSNKGDVYLCSVCKNNHQVRNLPKKDAMNGAILGGAWESNRKKH